MVVPEKVRRLTEAEFLALERAAEFKSEFFDGEIFAMAGGTSRHSLIATNLAIEFGSKLVGKNCIAFNSDLRLKVEPAGLFTYPDLSIVCGEPRFLDERMDTLLNPILLAEVLSDSTEAYDRGVKFNHYRQIWSLREYLLVSQKEASLQQFVRQEDGSWLLRDVVGLGAALHCAAVPAIVPLAEIYLNANFTPGPLRPATAPGLP